MSKGELYIGREQTLVKHFILEKYLERFAHIVGTHWDVLTYVDCFSGPWNARSEKFEDSSFAIALNQLLKARHTHAQRGRKIHLRCFFLEKNRAAYARLEKFAASVTDATIQTRNAALEESVPNIVDFVRRGGTNAFPFILIDPTGWSGFEMDTIAPLLRLRPSEVLINFMTGHIRRFLESPLEETQDSFRRLFGSGAFRDKVHGLAQQDREEAAVEEYARNVKQVGGFNYTCSAIILDPELDRTHFHLIYATRNLKGVEVFKDVEKKAMEVQEAARAKAHQRRRETRTHQFELLDSNELHDPSHYNWLRERHLGKARNVVEQSLQAHGRLLYDDVWELALSEPMIWESDLKEWIKEWHQEGRLELTGLQPRQHVPRLNAGNCLVWKRA
jgi:three-Cys-motif partner protein